MAEKISIKVIGPGCYFCKKLYRQVQEVVTEKGIDADVQHVTDFRSFMKYFPWTPVLIVDGEVRHKGKWLPNKEKINALIQPQG